MIVTMTSAISLAGPPLQWWKCPQQYRKERNGDTDGQRDRRWLLRLVEHRRERSVQSCADDHGHEHPEAWIWKAFALPLGLPTRDKEANLKKQRSRGC